MQTIPSSHSTEKQVLMHQNLLGSPVSFQEAEQIM